MNVEKLTQNAQSAIMECQNIAISEGHQMLEVEHLHLALLMQSDGLIPKLLKNMEVEPAALIGELQAEIEKFPKVSGNADNIYASRRLNQVLINAEKEDSLLLLSEAKEESFLIIYLSHTLLSSPYLI